ncbi:hypothetical protein HYC85_017987 [Camellia sinensis]|uniref:Uncharacterized protein n=1 Tax=Camellia sinensis TaxID=4442 RepID=A0A7J7GT97_CAMSI|nr:hypothetical protein HYC85_017987 [Camellia sinensis]
MKALNPSSEYHKSQVKTGIAIDSFVVGSVTLYRSSSSEACELRTDRRRNGLSHQISSTPSLIELWISFKLPQFQIRNHHNLRVELLQFQIQIRF